MCAKCLCVCRAGLSVRLLRCGAMLSWKRGERRERQGLEVGKAKGPQGKAIKLKGNKW